MHELMEEADKAADQIAVLYAKASAYLDGEMDHIFERYQMKHGLTKAEAMRLLDAMHDKTSLDELLSRLRAGDERQRELLAQLEGAAYGARLERLAYLRSQLDGIMTGIYEQELQISEAHYIGLSSEAYYRTVYEMQRRAEAAFSFRPLGAKVIDRAVHSRWSGKNYSERIWDNTQALADRVKEELLVNLATGRTNREAADEIVKEFARGASDARRLIWTESAYLSAELDFQAYEEMGVERYEYLATLDLKTCENCCGELDGKIFLVWERKIGENCPPMHPWCRCTTVSVVPDSLNEKLKRWARDPVTGRGMRVPASMTYREWHDKYVKGNPEAEFEERKAKALPTDKAQYERYKKALGRENIPKTLDEFQNMKYTESEKWQFVKLDFRRREKLRDNPGLKLPNAENVTLPEGKFTKYLLGGENETGLAKGRAFTSRLGYDINNWRDLQKELQRGAAQYPAILKSADKFGVRYEQKMVLYGRKGMPANVVVGWIQKPDGAVSMTSAYIKEVK